MLYLWEENNLSIYGCKNLIFNYSIYNCMKKISSFAFLLMCFGCIAQQSSRISVYNKTFTTYPYGDPNPVPDPTAPIYPYNHFDGYTNTSVRKEWKVVELENDFIKVMILPEIGGKIWTAIEKK